MKKFSILKKIFPAGLIVLAGVFVLTSSWDNYQSHPLKPAISHWLPTFSLNDSKVVVAAKAMTPAESKRNFGHDLNSRGVQPVQLSIENNTSDEYSLCPSSVDLPRIETRKIAAKITKSTLARGIAYKIAGFFFWPLMIPGTIDSIRVMKHHQDIKKDLNAKSMRDEIIPPYSTFHRVLFVPMDQFQKTFKVTLIDLESLKPTEFATTIEDDQPAEAPKEEAATP